MQEGALTKQHLETLTNDELFGLADELSLDLPPLLNRIFVIEEILESIGDEEQEEEENDDLVIDEKRPPVEIIPLQYFATYMHVLLRDPYWAYVFWEIRGTEKAEIEKDPGFEGYFLRVLSLSDTDKEKVEASFTISLKQEDTAWYVGLPATSNWYRIDLCLLNSGEEERICTSGAFIVPPPCDLQKYQVYEKKKRNIAKLCGIDRIVVLRAKERSNMASPICAR